MDLAKVVSTTKQYTFNEGSYSLEKGEFNPLDAIAGICVISP
jgi:carbamoyl-phosphate synthase small subunit